MTHHSPYSYSSFLAELPTIIPESLGASIRGLKKSRLAWERNSGEMEEQAYLSDVFEGKYERKEGMIHLPPLESYLHEHYAHIPEDALIDIWDTFMMHSSDNFMVSIWVIEEVIRRQNIDLEKRVIQSFIKVLSFSESGHRSFNHTVYDQLIEIYFCKFHAESLSLLLHSIGMDFLDARSGDGFEVLFGAAFQSAGDKKIQKKLHSLLHEYIEYMQGYPDSIRKLLSQILPVVPEDIAKDIRSLGERYERIYHIQEILRTGEVEQIEKIILQFGDTLGWDEYLGVRRELFKKIQDIPLTETTGFSLFHYILSQVVVQVTYSFTEYTLLSQLLERYSEKTKASIQNMGTQIESGFWEVPIMESLRRIFEKYQSNSEHPVFLGAVEVGASILKQSKTSLIHQVVTDRVMDMLDTFSSKNTKDISSFRAFLDTQVSILGKNPTFLKQLETTRAFAMIAPELYRFQMTSAAMLQFFISYFEMLLGDLASCMDTSEWKAFDLYVEQLTASGLLSDGVFPERISSMFATFIAENVSIDDQVALEGFKRCKHIHLQPQDRERVYAQFLGWAINNEKTKMCTEIISLLPTEIHWHILAYNLACYYARRKQKDQLLYMTQRALELGKKKTQFLDDPDFETYIDDSDFRQVLSSTRKMR